MKKQMHKAAVGAWEWSTQDVGKWLESKKRYIDGKEANLQQVGS